jgi:hypothetical protein
MYRKGLLWTNFVLGLINAGLFFRDGHWYNAFASILCLLIFAVYIDEL